MGIGITQFFAARGIRVSLADRSADEVRRSVHKLTAQVERWFEKNLVSEGERARIAQHIDVAASIDEACSEVTLAIEAAMGDIKAGKAGLVPPHLRDGHYSGAAALGNAQGYTYPHDDPDGIVPQQYSPDDLLGVDYYRPTTHGAERDIAGRLDKLRAILRRRR